MGHNYLKDDAVTLAVIRNNKVICVVVYHGYCPPDNIECSIVATDPRWKNGGTLYHLFGYAFQHAKVHRITVRVAEDNIASIKLMKFLGFVQEGILREALNGKNVIVYGMLRKECKYLIQDLNYHEKLTKTATSS